jgi:hypothetical protein
MFGSTREQRNGALPRNDAMCDFQTHALQQRHSITSSAVANSDCGKVSPSALAALRLMISSKLGRQLNWKFVRLRASEYPVDIGCRTPKQIGCVDAVRKQAAAGDEVAKRVDRGQAVAVSECTNPFTMHHCESFRHERARIEALERRTCSPTAARVSGRRRLAGEGGIRPSRLLPRHRKNAGIGRPAYTGGK